MSMKAHRFRLGLMVILGPSTDDFYLYRGVQSRWRQSIISQWLSTFSKKAFLPTTLHPFKVITALEWQALAYDTGNMIRNHWVRGNGSQTLKIPSPVHHIGLLTSLFRSVITSRRNKESNRRATVQDKDMPCLRTRSTSQLQPIDCLSPRNLQGNSLLFTCPCGLSSHHNWELGSPVVHTSQAVLILSSGTFVQLQFSWWWLLSHLADLLLRGS